jgi:hypothetical protein
MLNPILNRELIAALRGSRGHEKAYSRLKGDDTHFCCLGEAIDIYLEREQPEDMTWMTGEQVNRLLSERQIERFSIVGDQILGMHSTPFDPDKHYLVIDNSDQRLEVYGIRLPEIVQDAYGFEAPQGDTFTIYDNVETSMAGLNDGTNEVASHPWEAIADLLEQRLNEQERNAHVDGRTQGAREGDPATEHVPG